MTETNIVCHLLPSVTLANAANKVYNETMLDNIIFSLNIVMPLVALAALGYIAKRTRLIDRAFLAGGNKLVFYFGIPATLFNSIYNADLSEIFDPAFMAFVAVWTIATFAVIWTVTHFALYKRHPGVISAFVNGAHRGNLAMVALPLLFNMMGDDAAKTAAAMIVIIPIYNIQTLVLLTIHSESKQKFRIRPLLTGIIKNPPIVGTLLAIAISLIGINLPTIAAQTVNSLAVLTVPLALICLGAAMSHKGFDAGFKFALISSLIKVIVMPAATVAAALLLGFRGNDLTILMIINGVPSAVGAYVMIVEMGGDVYVSGKNVMLTTVLSAFTLSVLIFVFRAAGIIG